MPSFASFLAHLPGLVQPDLLVVFLPMFFGSVALPWILSINDSGHRIVVLIVAFCATVASLRLVVSRKEKLQALCPLSGRRQTVESDPIFDEVAFQVVPMIATVAISCILQFANCGLGAKVGYAALILVFGMLPGLYFLKCIAKNIWLSNTAQG